MNKHVYIWKYIYACLCEWVCLYLYSSHPPIYGQLNTPFCDPIYSCRHVG